MMSRLAFDAFSAVVLALTALLGAYLPVYFAKLDKLAGGTGRSLTYVLGNMLSAGVMVSAGFCHLLGEAVQQMKGIKMRFPLATFLCGLGYLFTLVADKIAAHTHGGGHGCGGGHALAKLPAADSCCAVEVLAGMDIAERGRADPARLAEKHSSSSEGEAQGLLECTPSRNGRLAGSHSGGSSLYARPVSGSSPPNGRLDPDKEDGGSGGVLRRAPLHRDSTESLVFEVETPPANPALASGAAAAAAGRRSVSFLTAVLMGVALCFHSLLEGAAMGAQATISNSLHIFIAIVSHKGLAAYALGSSIVDSEASMQSFWSVVLPFTFASPLGIFVGYIISDIAKGVGAASISALASGTFLYVAFMEVIPKELKEPAHMAKKLAALVAGFGLMSLLAVWA